MKLSTSVGSRPKYYIDDEHIYKSIHDAGFKYFNYDINGADYTTDDWKPLAHARLESFKRAELIPIMAHGPYLYPLPEEGKPVFFNSCKRAIEFVAELRIPYIVLHPDARKGMSYDEFLSVNRDQFRSLIPELEKTGVVALIENIGQFCDPHFVRDGAELKKLIDTVEHPLFAACWDTGHANHVLKDQCESIRTLGPLLKGLHVNDNLGDLEPKSQHWMIDMHTLPLFGTTDFDGIIRTLNEINYNGYFNFETDKPRWHDFSENDKIQNVMTEIHTHTLKLLYETGRLMLSAYDCFEE